MVIKRFGVYLVSLDPTVGSEISKTRPAVVISPDEMNRHIRTVDKSRLVKSLGSLDARTSASVTRTLLEMFA